MKVTLIVTVLNEEKSIDAFLESVANQTRKPDEFIVVDGGSVDWTVDKLYKSKVEAIVIIQKDASRSEGRNFGIERAKNEIIAVTDAGCILDKNWLLEITKPFEDENVNAVSGYFLPKTENVFQKCIAPFFCLMPEKLEKELKKKDFEFLPSSRSVAFKKSVWRKSGGYPENLNYCEDLAFDQKIKKEGYKFYFVKSAVVYWPQRKNLKAVFMQFYNYAVGDGQVFFSSLQTHSFKILTIFLRYFYFFAVLILSFKYKSTIVWLPVLIVLYLLWAILKRYRFVKDLKAVFWLPVLQITSDLAVMGGTIKGITR